MPKFIFNYLKYSEVLQLINYEVAYFPRKTQAQLYFDPVRLIHIPKRISGYNLQASHQWSINIFFLPQFSYYIDVKQIVVYKNIMWFLFICAVHQYQSSYDLMLVVFILSFNQNSFDLSAQICSFLLVFCPSFLIYSRQF